MNELFLLLFRFNGVPYALNGMCANRESMMVHAQRIASRRNVDIPNERTELVNIYQVGQDITAERAEQWKQQLKELRASMGYPEPEDIDPANPIRILHTPVTPDLMNTAGSFAPFGR